MYYVWCLGRSGDITLRGLCAPADHRVASMTVEQLADLPRLEDVEEMADDLALQLGVDSSRHHNKYNDQDIIEGLKNSGKECSNR